MPIVVSARATKSCDRWLMVHSSSITAAAGADLLDGTFAFAETELFEEAVRLEMDDAGARLNDSDTGTPVDSESEKSSGQPEGDGGLKLGSAARV